MGLTPAQWASERVLRVCCVAEVLAETAAARTDAACTEPLFRALYASILRDEVRHKHISALYIDYAYETWTDAERVRLGRVLADELMKFRGLWHGGPHEPVGATVPEHRLGFLCRGELASVALEAALGKIVKPLAEIDGHEGWPGGHESAPDCRVQN